MGFCVLVYTKSHLYNALNEALPNSQKAKLRILR